MTDDARISITPTPRVQRTLARAEEMARTRGHTYLGTEHLLLALLDDPDGIAGQVLHRDQRGPVLREAVERIMADPSYSIGTGGRPRADLGGG
jgi:ATP-dependent Clp protease ATP-binding subunit ClpC